MNVLIADDDQVTGLLLTSALSKLGQTVGPAALQLHYLGALNVFACRDLGEQFGWWRGVEI